MWGRSPRLHEAVLVIERPVMFETDVRIAGTLCLPEDTGTEGPVPAFVLLGGTGGDTRNGDLAPERTPGVRNPPKRGLLRRIAHRLATEGIATLRFDKRGCGESGGTADASDYDTDLVDNTAAFRWLQAPAEIDATRVGLIGHSAGAFNACMVCRDVPDVAAVGLLGALYEPIDELIRRNWKRIAEHWDRFTSEQREWLKRERPREVVGSFNAEAFIDAARRGEPSVVFEAQGLTMTFHTVRACQDLERPVADAFDYVSCPALVLHGGNDLNVRVQDALHTYQRLRAAGNEAIELVIVPGVDHSFQPVSDDPAQRIWDRVSLESFARPVSGFALDALAGWAARTVGDSAPRR